MADALLIVSDGGIRRSGVPLQGWLQ
jgi:hypothetical protein